MSDFRRVINLREFVPPWSVSLEMPEYVRHHLTDLRALMVARAFVMHVSKRPLNRVGLRTVRWQEDQFKAGMSGEPGRHRCGRMNAVVVTHHVDARMAFQRD